MSILIILSSLSNSALDSDFASCVLPTPVGPKNMNEPIGFLGSLSPERALNILSATDFTASSCPMTSWCSMSWRWSNLSLSVSTSFCTGMPVH